MNKKELKEFREFWKTMAELLNDKSLVDIKSDGNWTHGKMTIRPKRM